MSQSFFYWLGAYLAISAVVGFWSWFDFDLDRSVAVRLTFRRNVGLGAASFIRAFIWPVYLVSVTGFLLRKNYRRWQKDRAERIRGIYWRGVGGAPRRTEPLVLGPDPPGRPPIGWPVYEGRSLQPARVPGPEPDYGFSCAAGLSGQEGFVDLQRYGPHFILRIRSMTPPVGEQAIMLTPQQVRNIWHGCALGLPQEPDPVLPPPPPPEPVRRTSWDRLVEDED